MRGMANSDEGEQVRTTKADWRERFGLKMTGELEHEPDASRTNQLN